MPTGLHLWSRTAASNATADSSINWAEGQSPSSVNDSARAMMARVAEWRDDLGGLTTAGASTAYSVSTNRGFASAAAMDKAIITIIPHVTSGADPTLSVDGLTARPIRTATGVNAPSGALAAGTPYALVYVHASAEFILLGTLGAIGALGNTVTVQGAASDFKAFEGISTDAGAAQGPLLDLYRNSATPAAGDNLGAVNFYGKDDIGNKELYARLFAAISDPTNASEDGAIVLQAMVAGVLTTVLQSSGANISVPGALTAQNGFTVSAGSVSFPAASISEAALAHGAFTIQYLTSGSGTYTTPSGCRAIRIKMRGGGGGGGARTTNAGSVGGDTSFNSVVAKGGGGGAVGSDTGGAGGTGGAGSASLRIPGNDGQPRHYDNSGLAVAGDGGTGDFGSYGHSLKGQTPGPGGNAPANTGGGGGGGNNALADSNGGSGGGAGEYVELIITSPAASYSYTVGAGGAGGVAGVSKGGDGGSGYIIVEEYY